jgi:hypothetical protein
MKHKKSKFDFPWTPFLEMQTLTILGKTQTIEESGFYKVVKNSRYTVSIRRVDLEMPFGKALHLSIRRNDRAPIHDWRDLQRIKNELMGPESEAIELYPANSRLVDAANQYHLWLFESFEFKFGFDNRDVSEPDEAAKVGAVQKPFEPDMLAAFGGVSVGQHLYYKERKS